MTAVFKASAKTPGQCALKGCRMPGNKIYEGDGLRLLCCSQGHADAALQRVAKVSEKFGLSRERRDDVLRVFNTTAQQKASADDNDDHYLGVM